MSLNCRAFQPGLSPSVMAYSQPALWSRLLFLIAGFKNNCPPPFKKRQLGNDLVQKAYLSVTELGNDQDLFASQVTTVSVIISMGWRDWQSTQGCCPGGAEWGHWGCPSPALPWHRWTLLWDAPGMHSWRCTPENLAKEWWKGWGKQHSAVWMLLGFFWAAVSQLYFIWKKCLQFGSGVRSIEDEGKAKVALSELC